MSVRQDPASRANAVTAGAGDLGFPCDALWVGGAGDVTVVTTGGDTVTFTVPAGAVIPVQCSKVTAATADNIVALGH